MLNCAVYIIDGAGQTLAGFDYSGELPDDAAQDFKTLVLEAGRTGTFVRVDDEYSLAHMRKGSIYIVGAVRCVDDQDRILKTLIRIGEQLKQQISETSPAAIVNNRAIVKDIVDSMVVAA